MSKVSSLSAFFPCYNEEDNVLAMVSSLEKTLKKITKKFEIIIVDDGSTDATLQKANKLALKKKNVKVVSHPENRGYGAAVKSGLQAAKYDWVFLIDGDQQFDPAELIQFIPHVQNYQAVFGYRKKRVEGVRRKLIMLLLKLYVLILFGIQSKDIDCAFKLMRRDLVADHSFISEGAMISTELLHFLHKKKVKIKQIPVSHLPRKHGQPTGNSPRVILKAVWESLNLRISLFN